jgi:hypothetical protein
LEEDKMAVSIGTVATAAQYNALRTLVNTFFGDPNPSMVFGDGSQTYGWGGSIPSIVVAGVDLAEEIDWNAFVDRVNIGSNICNGVSGNQSQAGALMYASEYNSTENYANSIISNRLDIEASDLSLNLGGVVTQAATFANTMTMTVRYTFASFAQARYFFNSGGGLNITMALTGGTTGNALSWANLFTDIGTITMNYTQTVKSGWDGTPLSIGYYDLTTSFQEIFSGAPGGYSSSYSSSAYYHNNEIEISARRSATGTWVEIRVICYDIHSGSVDGTKTLTTQYRKLINQTSGAASLSITAPTYSQITNSYT